MPLATLGPDAKVDVMQDRDGCLAEIRVSQATRFNDDR